MSVITVGKASRMICPFSMARGVGPSTCRASSCMAWRELKDDTGECTLMDSGHAVAWEIAELRQILLQRDANR